MSNSYLYSYEGVESLDNYASEQELDAYREEALKFFRPMAGFIKYLANQAPVDVVDVGSGNSALLYNLEQQSVLKSGVAIEVSSSRSKFAEKWKLDKGFSRVNNVNSDFRVVELANNSVDCFVCNGTFHLLSVVEKTLPFALLEKAYYSLRPSGCLVLDIPTHRAKIEKMIDGEYSFIVNLPETNPFSSALYEMSVTEEPGVIRSSSKYFDNNGVSVRRKLDMFYSYSVCEISDMLHSIGFESFNFYEAIDERPLDEESSDSMLVVAKKGSSE